MAREAPQEESVQALEQAAALVVRSLIGRQGLSLTSRTVLARLDAEGPVRLTALAEGACVSQPSMTQLIQRLERDGLAARVSDPADGRATLVDITGAGRALLARLRAGLRGRLAQLLATLSVEEEATLTMAMHVALPIIQRLNDNAAEPRTPARPSLGESATGGLPLALTDSRPGGDRSPRRPSRVTSQLQEGTAG